MRTILVGFMACGKTSVSTELSDKLSIEVADMDKIILERSNRDSITDIFKLDGESEFRKLETLVLEELLKRDNIIISTGGGVIKEKCNRELIKESDSKVIFLEATFDVLKKRTEGAVDRPLFQDLEKAKELFDERQNLYLEVATKVINTNNIDLEEVVSLI